MGIMIPAPEEPSPKTRQADWQPIVIDIDLPEQMVRKTQNATPSLLTIQGQWSRGMALDEHQREQAQMQALGSTLDGVRLWLIDLCGFKCFTTFVALVIVLLVILFCVLVNRMIDDCIVDLCRPQT